MKICLVVKPGHADSGVGRYAQELAAALRRASVEVVEAYPVVPLPGWLVRLMRRFLRWDLVAFFNNYPIWARYPRADLYHLTSQNLATLLLFYQPPGKTVITVHDIIPWLLKDNRELCVYHHPLEAFFDTLALRGIRRANGWLADSDFTAQMLSTVVNIPLNRIETVFLGIS